MKTMRFPTTAKTLIDKLKTGDENAWLDFFLRYQPIIHDLGIFRGLTESESDDLVQEVMKKFHIRTENFTFDPSIAKFRTYFSRIINGVIIDIKRRRKDNELPLDEANFNISAENTLPPDELLDNALLFQWRIIIKDHILESLKNRISPLNYSIFEMHVLQNTPPRQTAKLLNVSVARVYIIKSRCLKILQTLVKEALHDDPELELNINDFSNP